MIKEYTFVLGQSSCEIAFAITKIPKDKHYIGKEMVQYYPMEILYKNITHTLIFSESVLQVLMEAELPGEQMQELFRALIVTQQLVWVDHWPDYNWPTVLALVINAHLACCILCCICRTMVV